MPGQAYQVRHDTKYPAACSGVFCCLKPEI
jgi:hypothetical protein